MQIRTKGSELGLHHRLVRPAGTKPIEPQICAAAGGGGGKGGIDPIIQGLLGRLPKSGDVWPEADRKLWLDLLAGSFKLIYKDKDEATN